jgi:alpha-ketoglutarate-dependent taurine dioxygenase
LLFRGFEIDGLADFRRVSLAVDPTLVRYTEPATPRTEHEDRIYESSEYPSYHSIHLHSELSYTYAWPLQALFHCAVAPAVGGETPLGDNRTILAGLDPRVRERFVRLGVTYLRNYGEGLKVPWQKVFATDDPRMVEDYCRRNPPMRMEWKPDGGLRTRSIRPAVTPHPLTGEPMWFNQAHIFHIGSLGATVAEDLLATFGEEGLPVHAFYGDGTRIGDADLAEVFRMLEASKVSVPWRQGDVLLADNVRMSHGRNAFEGARQILVSFVGPNDAAAAVAAGAVLARRLEIAA